MRAFMNSIPRTDSENLVGGKSQITSNFKKFIFFPIKAGVYGFTLVLAVIMLLKLLSYVLGVNASINLDIMDILLSSVGFFFMFLIYVLKNFH